MNIQDILSPTNARSEFYNILKAVNENHKPILINGSKSENNAVIIGKEDWDNIQEILNLEYSNVVNQSHRNKAETLYDTIEQQAIIASYGDANSSLWGKRIANDTVEQGHRVFHVIANNFEYEINDEKDEVIDLSRVGLNPVEMFGNSQYIVNVYNTTIKKIVQMIDLATGRVLTAEDKDNLRERINEFYLIKGLWKRRPEHVPKSILDIKSENIPKLDSLLHEVIKINGIDIEHSRQENGVTSVSERYEYRKNVMINILKEYPYLNKHTEIENPYEKQKEQYYYDLTSLNDNPYILEAQFLNGLNYILSCAEKQDVIMIHGLDRISVKALSILKEPLENAKNTGVKLVYLFDTIGGDDEIKDIEYVEYANLFNTEGILYQDINTDFGFKTLGTMNLKDIVLYKEKIETSLIND